MSVLIDVADAVKDQLNATDYGVTFEAKRVRAKTDKTLEELKTIVVEVVPRKTELSLATRGSPGREITVDIFLRLKMGAQDQALSTGEIQNDETDPLETLAEAIAESFMYRQPTQDGQLNNYEQASWKESKFMSGPAADQFTNTRIWQAQIRLVFVI